MKKVSFILVISLVILFYFPSLAEDSEFVENPARGGGRIVGSSGSLQVGERKYFVENPALRQAQGGERSRTTKGGGRDYIVRNPRATLPPPSGLPLANMDSTQPFEFLRVVSKAEPPKAGAGITL